METGFDKIDFKDIVPADYNPRILSDAEYTKLSKSIDEFGLVDPIIINLKNNHIIGGHQRYRVMRDEYEENQSKYDNLVLLRRGDVGWVFTDNDLTIEDENHEKALNIALNKISGEWDNFKLSELFNDLNTIDFDISLTGFDDFEIDLYLDEDLETFDYENYSDDYELPDDYVDVQGDKANKSFVVSIGFDNHEIANKFLDYIDYHRHMTRDTLQFMFTELDWDLDELIREKEETWGKKEENE